MAEETRGATWNGPGVWWSAPRGCEKMPELDEIGEKHAWQSGAGGGGNRGAGTRREFGVCRSGRARDRHVSAAGGLGGLKKRGQREIGSRGRRVAGWI